LVEVGQGRDAVGKLASCQRVDRATPQSRADPPVVVQYRNPVGRTPHVALETCGAHSDRRLEGLEGVLRSMRTASPVGEQDRLEGPLSGMGHGSSLPFTGAVVRSHYA
jgi:hypothetical protein